MKGNFNITKRESKKMIWCWKITYVNTWQMPPFIGQKVELLIGGHPLILWLVLDIIGCWFLMLLAGLVAGFWCCWLVWLLVFDIVGCCFWYCWLVKTSLLTSELEPFVPSKLWAIVLAFQQKKPDLIWTSRTRDMTRKPNRARAVRTASDVSVVSTIWTWKRQIWVLDSSWKL